LVWGIDLNKPLHRFRWVELAPGARFYDHDADSVAVSPDCRFLTCDQVAYYLAGRPRPAHVEPALVDIASAQILSGLPVPPGVTAFSPDGLELASLDARRPSILRWSVKELIGARGQTGSSARPCDLWDRLAAKDARLAYQAARRSQR